MLLTRRAAKRYLIIGEAYCSASPCGEISSPARSCSRDTRKRPAAWAGRGLPAEGHVGPSGGVALHKDPVDQSPFDPLLRGHEVVAIQGPFHLLLGAPAMLRIEPDDPPFGFLHFVGMDQDVGGLALEAAERLMHVKAGIGQRGAVTGFAG